MTNIHEAKAKLTEFLDAAARGERVLICKRNRPIAELRALASARTQPRPTGGALPELTVPATFFEPLADDVLAAFEGGAIAAPASRVAEKKASYRPTPRRPKRG